MCKYCDGSHQLEMYSDTGLRAEISNNYGVPRLVAYTTIDAGFLGYADIDGNLDIYYCPICGCKLVEDEDAEE